MNIKLAHGIYENCTIRMHEYPNGGPALVIYQDDQVLLKASVNIPEYTLPEGYICIKNWSENEGILESLIENNIIDPPRVFIPLSFNEAPVCKLKGGLS